MSHIQMIAISVFCAMVGITLAGCGGAPAPQRPVVVSSENEDPKVEHSESEKNRSPTYIACRATLVSFDKDHP